MGNHVTYSNSKYGVEKMITFPLLTLTSDEDRLLVLTEDIVVTEIGGFVTTVVSGIAGATMTVAASGASSTTIATVSAPTGGAAGDTVRQTTMTDADAGVSGSVLVLSVSLSNAGTGIMTPYIKYRSNYIV